MAVIESGTTPVANQQFVETNSAARVSIIGRGATYGATGTTGTIAAAVAANSVVFAARLDPAAPLNAFIDRIHLSFTTLVAFTVPVTAGRRLEIVRGSGAATSGGTSIPASLRKRSSAGASQMDLAEGGDVRIATTGALTVAGITFEAVPGAFLSLAHAGAAGAFVETTFEFAAAVSAPIQLEPGQLIAVRTPVAMDAAGTWQLSVSMNWHEAAAI